MRNVQGEVFEVFTGTTCSRVRCLRDVLIALTHAVPFFFHALAMILMCALKQKQKSDANKCKMESKSYLECRMAKELMASQPLAELGFKEDQKEETNENRGRKEEENKRSTKEEENERNGFVAGARRARQQQKELTEEAYRRRREGR